MKNIHVSKDLLVRVRDFDVSVMACKTGVSYETLMTHALALRATILNAARDLGGLDKEIADELKQFSLYGPSADTMSDQEVFDIVIHKKLGSDNDGLTIWPEGVSPEQYDRVMDLVDSHLGVRDIR